MSRNFDRYTAQARLLPVLLVFLPIGVAIVGFFPVDKVQWGLISGLLTTFGFTGLLSQVGRDQGKKKEPSLYKMWGGAPTTLMLSYNGSTFNRLTLERYHSKLSKLLDTTMPSPELEKDNLKQALELYQSFVDFLKERTRDRKSFPLVFAENVNYGFRRNLWGLKTVGLLVASFAFLASASSVYLEIRFSNSVSVSSVFSALVSGFLLILWFLCINPGWVKVTADAYAQRLVASCENL